MKGIIPIHESVAMNPHPNPPPCTGEGTFRADTEDAEKDAEGGFLQRRKRGCAAAMVAAWAAVSGWLSAVREIQDLR